jgi:hypothetical protein
LKKSKKTDSKKQMIKSGESIRVSVNERYEMAKCLRIHKKSVTVILKDGTTKTVPFSSLWKLKVAKKHKYYKGDDKVITKRLGRHVGLVNVVPTRFEFGKMMGNFQAMLHNDKIRETGVMMFNDNKFEFEEHGQNPHRFQNAGGGNAAARPWQHLGDAIGVPTGPFATLQEKHGIQLKYGEPGREHTVTDIINEAFNRIVCLFLDNPNKNTLYFSVNPNDLPNSVRLGLGIFANQVGDDVIDYISDKIQQLPLDIQSARIKGIRP